MTFTPRRPGHPPLTSLCSLAPPSGDLRNLAYDEFWASSRALSPCTAPLDSGFRRNDGGCAKNPFAKPVR